MGKCVHEVREPTKYSRWRDRRWHQRQQREEQDRDLAAEYRAWAASVDEAVRAANPDPFDQDRKIQPL